MTAIDNLRAIAPPPCQPPGRNVDWEATETQLGLILPEDYRGLITEWGAGSFDDFVTLYEPGHPNPNLELVHRAEDWRWAMGETAKDEPLRFPTHIGVGGVLAWGSSANGDPCFWHLRSEDPDAWVIFIQEARGPDWYVYEGGLAEFLVAFLERRERVVVFPDDVSSAPPRFLPARDVG
jgi:hypothetical protein